MNQQIKNTLKDGLVLTIAASLFATVCNYGFSALKGAGVKSDPLVTAILQSNTEEMDNILSEKGFAANPEGALDVTAYKSLRAGKPDTFGRTPLMWASYVNFLEPKTTEATDAKRLEAVARLLNAGADVNAADKDGWTALMWAAWSGMPKTAELLMTRGATLNAVDKHGQSALMMAAMRGNAPLVLLLVARGADKTLKSAFDKTALDYVNLAAAQYPERANYERLRQALQATPEAATPSSEAVPPQEAAPQQP